MSITLEEALAQLNIDDMETDAEVALYVDAANEWIATHVTDTSPAPVRLATLFLIEHWWESQRGPATTPIDDEMAAFNGTGFAIPNRVLELLNPFLTRTTPSYSFPDAVAFPDPAEW